MVYPGYIFRVVSLFIAVTAGISAFAQKQDKAPSMDDIIEREADRLQQKLQLEDWQVFYVDSILRHDMGAMQAEYDKLQKMKMNNASSYQSVQDKWMESIDNAYKKIFTVEQWNAYLKSGAGKMQKQREKRRMKAGKNTKNEKKN